MSMIALTESFEACLIDSDPVYSDFALSSTICDFKIFLFLIFFSGDQLGPLRSFKTSFSSSLKPSKNFFQPKGIDSGSSR